MATVGTIILDFDGVLAESNQAKSDAFEDFFKYYPEYSESMRQYHLENYNISRMVKFEHYVFEMMGRPGDREMVNTMAQQFSAIVKERVIAAADVPGARAFLQEFSQRAPLYIASVTPRDELQEIVRARGIAPFITEVFGNPPTLKVDAVHRILSREGLPPSQAVFIGDSSSDYQVALATGVGFLGRDSGFGFDEGGVQLYKDLFEIAVVVRERMKGEKI